LFALFMDGGREWGDKGGGIWKAVGEEEEVPTLGRSSLGTKGKGVGIPNAYGEEILMGVTGHGKGGGGS